MTMKEFLIGAAMFAFAYYLPTWIVAVVVIVGLLIFRFAIWLDEH